MLGPIVTALVAWLVALVFASQNKETQKPRSLPLAMVAAFIGSISLVIAFPKMLGWDRGVAGTMIVQALVLAVGVILILLAVATEKVPTGIVLLGMFVVVWAVCRMLPTAPNAFEHLGPNLTKAWDAIVFAVKTFFTDIVP